MGLLKGIGRIIAESAEDAGRITRNIPTNLARAGIPINLVGSPGGKQVSTILKEMDHLIGRYPDVNISGGINLVHNPRAIDLASMHPTDAAEWIEDPGAFANVQSRAITIGTEQGSHLVPVGKRMDQNYSVVGRAMNPEEHLQRIATHEFGHMVHFSTLDKIHRGVTNPVESLSSYLHAGSDLPIGAGINSKYALTNKYEEFAELFTAKEYESLHPIMNDTVGRLEEVSAPGPIRGSIIREIDDQRQPIPDWLGMDEKIASSRDLLGPRAPSSGRMGGVPTRSRTSSRAHYRKSF